MGTLSSSSSSPQQNILIMSKPILIFLLLFSPSPILSDDPLCEPDTTDSTGHHLGCSCVRSVDGDSILKADCTKNWIGINNALNLPQQLNISSHVGILDLSQNQMTSLTPSTFGDCKALQTLKVSDNLLQSYLGVNCSRLMTLDLSHNRLKNLTTEALALTPRLVELDLSFNDLLFLDPNCFSQLKNLRTLKLGSNRLGMELFYSEEYILRLNNLERLEELDLSNSSLPDFPLYLINGTTHLKKLSLRDNLIQFIGSGVFEQLGELTALDLSGNLFSEIEPSQFYGLSSLHLLIMDKMTHLTAIREHAFSGLTRLHELSCQMNYYLTTIDSLAFRGDPNPIFSPDEDSTHLLDSHPKIVRLGDNDLHSIDYPLLQWQSLDILELHRNSFICDCNLQWVSDFYRHRPHEAAILNDSYFVCYEPHIFAGVPVVAVNPEEMLCFSPVATVAGTIGIVIFGVILFSFCTVLILNQMGMLPDWVRQYNIFGSGSNLPAYMRVNPRPSTKARRMVERVQVIPDVHCYSATTTSINNNGVGDKGLIAKGGVGEPVVDELEWDNADIGRT